MLEAQEQTNRRTGDLGCTSYFQTSMQVAVTYSATPEMQHPSWFLTKSVGSVLGLNNTLQSCLDWESENHENPTQGKWQPHPRCGSCLAAKPARLIRDDGSAMQMTIVQIKRRPAICRQLYLLKWHETTKAMSFQGSVPEDASLDISTAEALEGQLGHMAQGHSLQRADG